MRTREEIEVEMARLREIALSKVRPGDERSDELHAWIAIAWTLGPEVQRAEIGKLVDRARELEPDSIFAAF